MFAFILAFLFNHSSSAETLGAADSANVKSSFASKAESQNRINRFVELASQKPRRGRYIFPIDLSMNFVEPRIEEGLTGEEECLLKVDEGSSLTIRVDGHKHQRPFFVIAGELASPTNVTSLIAGRTVITRGHSGQLITAKFDGSELQIEQLRVVDNFTLHQQATISIDSQGRVLEIRGVSTWKHQYSDFTQTRTERFGCGVPTT